MKIQFLILICVSLFGVLNAISIGEKLNLDTIQASIVGCYDESDDKSIYVEGSNLAEALTQEKCLAGCIKDGFSFAAISGGNNCACVKSIDKLVKSSNENCNKPCPGDNAQFCGGVSKHLFVKLGVQMKFEGLYAFANGRDLNKDSKKIAKATHEACNDFCKKKNYLYAGLQSGSECYCGDSYGKYGKVEDRFCDKPCQGNNKQRCGGNWRNTILKVGDKPVVIGCFADAHKREIVAEGFSGAVNRTFCANYCRRKKFKFAAVQNGNECFCGNSYGKYGKTDEKDCNKVCVGNPLLTCGGLFRNGIIDVKDMNYIGCFVDGFVRNSKDEILIKITDLTQGKCLLYCNEKNYKYAGLKGDKGDQCVCTDKIDKYGKLNADDFKLQACSGDNRERCGDMTKVLYVTKGIDVTVLGCFDFNPKVAYKYELKDNTHDKCLEKCLLRGYNFAFVSGKNCGCDNSYGMKGSYRTNRCNSPCPGDNKQNCGADGLNLVVKQKDPLFNGLEAFGCQGSKLDIVCPLKQYILISEISYGRKSDSICGFSPRTKTVSNSFQNLKIVKQRCDNQHYCSLNVTDNEFPGDNQGQNNYLHVKYRCSNTMFAVNNLGCFAEAEGRDLKLKRLSSPKVNRQVCNDFCKDNGFKFAAVQQGEHCFCDNQYGAYGKVSDDQCNMRCKGNKREMCGGRWRNTIMKVGGKPEIVGCFADADARDLTSKRVVFKKLTVKFCRDYCQKGGFTFMSVQNGDNCFCDSDVIGNYGKVSENQCNVPCTGNKTENCGGLWRNSIYDLKKNKYLGCYVDGSSAKVISEQTVFLKDNTPEVCFYYCINLGYTFSAVSVGNRCSCSKTFSQYGEVDKSQCNVTCSGDKKEQCGAMYRLNVMQRRNVEAKKDPCRGIKSPCGIGALCKNVNGKARCSCPAGALGNPLLSCCKQLTCGCYGDPHCHSFDNAGFEFMGTCKYTLATTDCYKKKLPKHLEPFTILQKQEKRPKLPNANIVSFISYLELITLGTYFKLEKKNEKTNKHTFYVNNVITNLPYSHPRGLHALIIAGEFVVTTRFGLTIIWDGDHKASVLMCDTYSNHVCGLCGNADGNPKNDFVDRKNVPVALKGPKYTKYFEWGSKWRVLDRFDKQSKCHPKKKSRNDRFSKM